jgi:DNA-binding SARP family transcriptional activator
MEFRILGPLEVVEDGRLVDVGGPRQRALLAILLTRANEVVSRDRLVDELFGEEPRAAAASLVQVYVSRLRKALEPGRERRSGGSLIVTRPPGYAIRVGSDELDLHRFERLAGEGRRALAAGDAEVAATRLREALGLWRGPALADFAYEEFASVESARLEELRLVAVEDRIDAELTLGGHATLTAELQALVAEHPLRERPRGQLMLALYRSGRQAEALEVFHEGRRLLVDQLGLEPTAALRDLERAMLRQDPALDAPGGPLPESPAVRALLVLCQDDEELEGLLGLAGPLAAGEPPRDLVLVRLVARAQELREAVRSLNERRDALVSQGIPARSCAFTSQDPVADALRLVSEQAVELLLAAGLPAADEELATGHLGALLVSAACDIAILANPRISGRKDGPVVVPFGGGEHDWGALELGAWLASSMGAPLLLVGPVAEEDRGKRDASRLLARASLIVQRIVGVAAEPMLTAPGPGPVLEAASNASLLAVGLSSRWREEGAGPARRAIVEGARAPVLIVRRGVRPGGLAPDETLTRFTWSLAGEA